MRFGRAVVDDDYRAVAGIYQVLDGFIQALSADLGLDRVEHEIAGGMKCGFVIVRGGEGFENEPGLAHA